MFSKCHLFQIKSNFCVLFSSHFSFGKKKDILVMGNTGTWEFDCPQFIDFAAGLDNYPNDDWIGNLENGDKAGVAFSHRNKYRGPKMATPKVKPMKSLENSPYVNTLRPVQTDDEKLSNLHDLRRYSRSEDFLNRIDELEPVLKQPPRKTFHNGLRRSLSENCIKIKKKAYPRTPMCLKRTLNKPKGKTTEELELEKISELRNKLSQKLKLNEVNLKRMKNNKAPYAREELYKTNKVVELPNVKKENKGSKFSQQMHELKKDFGKSKFQNENCPKMPDIHREKNHVLMVKSKAENLQKVLNSIRPAPVMPSNTLRLLNGDSKEEKKFLHNKVPLAKYKGHSGLKFLRNKELTIPLPFSFDTSSTSLPNTSFQLKENKVHFSTNIDTNHARGKENFHPTSSKR